MATKKKASDPNRGSAKHKAITGQIDVPVSLSDEDREYLSGSLDQARARLGSDAATDESGVFEMLERFGLGSARVERLRAALGRLSPGDAVEKAGEYLAEQIESAREYSRRNPKKVIGGTAGVLVGASLLAMALSRAAGDEPTSRRSTTKRSGSTRKPAKTRSTSSRKSTSSTKRTTASAGSKKAASRSGASPRKSASKKAAGGTRTRAGASSRKK